MTPIRVFLAVSFFALLASTGCVSSTQQTDGDSAEVAEANEGEVNEDGQICRMERPTGSNIPREVCRDADEAESRRERDQQTLRDSNRFGCSGPGCE